MNESVEMSVSSMTRHGDNKAIYVLFTDGDKTAEFTVPDCALLSNSGFADDEIQQLQEYVENEQEYIFSIAKGINPLKAFMGEWK